MRGRSLGGKRLGGRKLGGRSLGERSTGSPGGVLGPLSDVAAYWDFEVAQSLVGNPGPTFTYSRGDSVGTYFDSSGVLQVSASHTPRFDHNFAGTSLGLLIEEFRQAEGLWSRDMTNAVWVKTNITAAKDATGLTAVANSASTLTATAGNGTCLQTVTKASEVNVYSVYVKRKTGTGDIDITIDGGTGWATLTGLSSINFTRYQITQTLANPAFGFRIVTSGDEIEVDINQLENAAIASTPMITEGTVVNRLFDDCKTTDLSFVSDGVGTIFVEFSPFDTTTFNRGICTIDTGSTNRIQLRKGGDTVVPFITAAGSSTFTGTTPSALVANQPNSTAMRYSSAAARLIANSTFGAEDTSVTIPANAALTTYRVGTVENGSLPLNGHVLKIKQYDRDLSDAEMDAIA